MQTLIELYDERPMENVLSTEMFRPQQTVFICPAEVAGSPAWREALKQYFRHRGVDTQLIFRETSLLDAEKVLRCLQRVAEEFPDCALDISGGTDAALFAGGLFCAERDIPVFTYSRRRNRYFDIRNAPFAHRLPCDIRLDVESCFLMAGGAMRVGRVDNARLPGYLQEIDALFEIYLRHRRGWVHSIDFLQRVSQAGQEAEGEARLRAEGERVMKGPRGGRLEAPTVLLEDLAAAGLISAMHSDDDTISFRFKDEMIRQWLRDVGAVLELKVYQDCLSLDLFDDVVVSAVVDWAGRPERDGVSNEIDVVVTRGVMPVFISCKTNEVHTEALNELSILRDRFGGQRARAAVVTGQAGGAPMRHRAAELGIDVIDLSDLKAGRLKERLAALAVNG